MIDQTMLVDTALDPAISELKQLVRTNYPSACFEVSAGPAPGEMYLIVTVDIDDPDDVMAVYIDRLVELQVEQRLPLYVMSLRREHSGEIETSSRTANKKPVA
jgi:hypothetical protein